MLADRVEQIYRSFVPGKADSTVNLISSDLLKAGTLIQHA